MTTEGTEVAVPGRAIGIFVKGESCWMLLFFFAMGRSSRHGDPSWHLFWFFGTQSTHNSIGIRVLGSGVHGTTTAPGA